MKGGGGGGGVCAVGDALSEGYPSAVGDEWVIYIGSCSMTTAATRHLATSANLQSFFCGRCIVCLNCRCSAKKAPCCVFADSEQITNEIYLCTLTSMPGHVLNIIKIKCLFLCAS